MVFITDACSWFCSTVCFIYTTINIIFFSLSCNGTLIYFNVIFQYFLICMLPSSESATKGTKEPHNLITTLYTNTTYSTIKRNEHVIVIHWELNYQFVMKQIATSLISESIAINVFPFYSFSSILWWFPVVNNEHSKL